MKVCEGLRHACAAVARVIIFTTDHAPPARTQRRSNEFDMRRERPVWLRLMNMLGNLWFS
eukprot:9226551-Pyramimonas_sp.AAC.1